MQIVIEFLLCFAGLFLMWFLGIMIFAFCFMANGKLEDDEKENENE